MSVINQVLNQLEQRGVHAAPDQPLVRAVPEAKRKYTKPLLVSGLVVVIGLVFWQWLAAGKMSAKPESTAPRAMASGAGSKDRVAVAEPVSVKLPEQPVTEPVAAASRLSFELGSVPLPTRQSNKKIAGVANPSQTGQNTSGQRRAQVVMPPAAQPPAAELPMKQVSKAQQADAEFHRAAELMRQGRTSDAIAGYEAALKLDAVHQAARQALVALLLEGKRGAEAEHVLQAGLESKPEQTGFAMLLARLRVERGVLDTAMATLEKSLPYADKQADYQAFFAALLQRQNRHKEAITHYQIALQLSPDNGVWLMGLGISMQAMQRNDEARNAFGRALESQTLSPELQQFVRQQIKAP